MNNVTQRALENSSERMPESPRWTAVDKRANGKYAFASSPQAAYYAELLLGGEEEATSGEEIVSGLKGQRV